MIGQSVNIIPPAKRRGMTGERRPATGDRRQATGAFQMIKKTNLSHYPSDAFSHGGPWSSTAKPVNSLRLGREFQASVLSAVYSEFNTIDRRSSSIVITGLPPKNDVTDAEQFANLVLSTSR